MELEYIALLHVVWIIYYKKSNIYNIEIQNLIEDIRIVGHKNAKFVVIKINMMDKVAVMPRGWYCSYFFCAHL